MNQYLKTIQDLLQQNNQLTEQDKQALLKTLTDADKQWSITEFKLDRTEKVKRTTAILLEETIEELEHKRKAVEEQNRELEIESSLEKVRTVAMGMRIRDDMLGICRTMSAQLESLGIKEIRNVQTAIFYKDKGTYINYEYYRLHDTALVTEVDYTKDEISVEFAAQMIKGADQVFIRSLEGQQVKDWLNFQKTTNVFIDTNLEKAKSLTYYWFSLGPVAIGTSTYDPLNEEEITLFKRFRNVFDLAYRRYLDIEKAEAQAYEAKIEASLERVRAVAMSLRKSEDLIAVCEVMYKELTVLGFTNIRNAQIAIKHDEKQAYVVCEYSDYAVNILQEAPYNSSSIVQELYNELGKTGDALYQKEFSGKEFEDWRRWRKSIKDSIDVRIDEAVSMCFYLFSMGTGHVGISTFNAISNEQVEILKRFKNVFELSYRRYTDVAKAEAQARESGVQLALERVRARTMAMQKSEELSDVATVLFQQVKALGVLQWACGFCIWDIGDTECTWYPGSADGEILTPTRFPLTEHPVFKIMDESRKRGDELYIYEKKGEVQADHYRYMMTLPGVRELLQDILNAGLTFPTFQIDHYANFAYGNLIFITYEHFPEMHDIFKRFARVFEQTYTRFLDLQKAEAQAREAQIELALERVRARTMAMQKSDELAETSLVLFQQFKDLGETSEQISIGIFKEDENIMELYSTLYGSQWKEAAKVDLDEPVVMKKIHAAWKEQKKSLVIDIAGNDLRKYNAYRKKLSNLEYREDRWVIHIAFFSKGVLTFSTTEPHPPGTIQLLERFAGVFDQTYTRFLDLQKAEAQAREAKIQLALERVRARTMAMQKSSELADVATVLFKELNQLVMNLWTCGFVLCERDRAEDEWWLCTEGGFIPAFYLPNVGDVTHFNIYQGWLKGETYHTEQIEGKALQQHYDWLMNIPVTKKIFEDMAAAGFEKPVWQKLHCAYFSKGYLCIITREPCREEEIFKRFAQVFDLTYTRFLDLQKAEAQAREAQIELGLERVRARAMAMQKSDELSELVDTVFKELTKLDFALTWCIINIIDESSMSNTVWAANPDINKAPESYHMLFEDYPFHHAMMKGWKERKTKYVYVLEGSEKKVYDEYLFNKTEFRKVPAAAQAASRAMEKYVVTFSFSNFGGLQTVGDVPLSDANLDILSRFGKVFDLTYTRFNDLKQAEAQARESQIQLALERVRARTMAMQNSNELPEAANLLFQQVQSLGMSAWSAGYCIWDEDKKAITLWMSSEGVIQPALRMPLTEDPYLMHFREGDERDDSFWVEAVGGEELKKHYAYLRTLPGVKESLDDIETAGFPVPTFQIFHLAYFSKGFLLFITYEPVPVAHDIFKRFGKVFEQTYTRFLDLQTAEAQARESQIQLALERVRARTMAMQRSKELGETAVLLFKQIADLGTKSWSSGFQIWQSDDHFSTAWMTNPDGSMGTPFTLPYTGDPFFKRIYEARKSGKDFFVMESSDEELKETYRYMFSLPEVKEVMGNIETLGFQMPTFQITHCAFFLHGFLMIITYEPVPELWDIFKRFAKVFEQTYTRFLDLQKAEAQARESQIQLALERVRARTMAMQRSDELAETASLLFKQISDLGIHPWTSGFNIWEKDDTSFIGYNPTPAGGITPPYHIPSKEDSFFINIYEAKKRGEDFFVFELAGESLAETYKYMGTLPVVKEVIKSIEDSGIQLPVFQINHCAFFSHGFLLFITLEAYPEAHDIFKRFAKVFEQTYTRFLDLQKAETQAREAKIEAALEKVRSRSLAMHKSDELREVVAVVFEKLQELHFAIDGAAFIITYREGLKDTNVWLADDHGQLYSNSMSLPYYETPSIKDIWMAKESGVDFFSKTYSFEEKNHWFHYAFEHTDIRILTDELKNWILQQPCLTQAFALAKNSLIGIHFHHQKLLSEKEVEILKRFSKVFDQAYIRFLDLQKAEAQAREAKIEAALEKVRSKTMAMHNSQDVGDTVAALFDEFVKLGIETFRCGIGIIHQEKKMEVWTAKSDVNGKVNFFTGYMDMTMHPLLQGAYSSWKNKQESYVYELKGDDLKEYFSRINNNPDYPLKYDIPSLPSRLIFSVFYFPEGFLFAFTLEEIPEEATKIFKRFSGVFGQTYRRYLDLKKAEAQAREAQIEAALERVRSRSMGMQKSEELKEIIQVVYEQLVHLNIQVEHTGFIMDYKERDDMHIWLADKHAVPFQVTIPYFDCAHWNSFNEAKEKGLNFFANHLSFEEKNKFYQDLFKLIPGVPEETLEYYFSCPGLAISTVLLENVGLYIENFSGIPYSDEENATLMRFGKVFQQTYTRFLDLQKAEAQAREAKIQLALERVRARTMAMHQSNEVKEVALTMYEQLQSLGFEYGACTIIIMNGESGDMEWWMAGFDEKKFPESYTIQNFAHTVHRSMLNGFIAGEKFRVIPVFGDSKKSYDEELFSNTGFKNLPPRVKDWMQDQDSVVFSLAYNKHGALHWGPVPLTDEQNNILQRFAKVFEQSYTRFLDLQKAEAQAREAQIELGLERVRARAMAMQNSDELSELVAILFEELVKLDLILARCIIWIFDTDTLAARIWMANSEDKRNAESYFIKRLDHPYYDAILKGWKERNPKWVYDLSGRNKRSIDELLLNETELAHLPGAVKTGILSSEHTIISGSFNNFGLIEASGPVAHSEEQLEILNRFGKVFDLSYTRFSDLKQAEAQAREAKIETAMEKVRARAMAMQKPGELVDVAQLLRKEMGLLGIEELETSSIYIHNEVSGTTECWYAIQDIREQNRKLVTDHMTIQLKDTWVGREMLKFYTSDQKQTSILMQGENRKEWINYCAQQSKVLQGYYGDVIPERTYHLLKFSNGYMGAASPGDISAESWNLLKRATTVFSLAYTRFSDLQLAEAQAREATIEAALERVRSRALAMHNSNDVSSAASIVFTELRKLGISPMRCGVGLITKEERKVSLYGATTSEHGDGLSLVGWANLDDHSVLTRQYECWLKKEDYFPVLKGALLKTYYEKLSINFTVPVEQTEYEQHGYFLMFSEGFLFCWSQQPYNEPDVRTLKRFASVIDLTFRRYIELQKSEANTREAVKQAALDRIRADIASMRTIIDLDRITPLIWNELTVLGVPFIRCGVFIMDDSQQLIHSFLSTPEGKAIAAFHIPYDSPGNIGQVLSHWQNKKNYIDHWEEKEFTEFANTLVKQGALNSPQQYLKTIPKGGFHLHFLPFLQGMLYVGNTTRLPEDEIKLIQSVADAFSTAYARYEDFNKLEAAKQQVDKTLVDLKQAQTQLVQSEKMASLGELTAGIAHEIQNPLNFVNNFSDVSNELLDEMKAELAKGNAEDAMAIADDVKQNLEKILHHGKRADAIVKGMLQHSRMSSGQKELTDINNLADEYLRLAYHGLRAKDKSFNAKFETDFDKRIDKINIIPQDIGRVLVNLITNAFYAVSEKAKAPQPPKGGVEYEPTVIVSTKSISPLQGGLRMVEIIVKDNGTGIPQKVLDKIFQPFFTTKPTGQGTGLGLSLAYDIITKGHGGELKVETREGEGSEFIISLPVV